MVATARTGVRIAQNNPLYFAPTVQALSVRLDASKGVDHYIASKDVVPHSFLDKAVLRALGTPKIAPTSVTGSRIKPRQKALGITTLARVVEAPIKEGAPRSVRVTCS